MTHHKTIAEGVLENESENGTCVLFTQSPIKIKAIGTVDTPDLVDFFETVFRQSDYLSDVIEEALERSKCPPS